MKTLLQNIAHTTLLAELPNRTVGTATAATFVSVSGYESNVITFNLGTANDPGSVTLFRILQGTAATPGAGTKVIGAGTLTTFTNGGSAYAIEVKSDQLDAGNGYTFIGAEVVTTTAGSATYGVHLIQHNARNAPPASGFGGTVMVLT